MHVEHSVCLHDSINKQSIKTLLILIKMKQKEKESKRKKMKKKEKTDKLLKNKEAE